MSVRYFNLYRTLLILFFFITAFGSCKKYLAQKPDSAQAVPATLADLQALLDYSNRMNLQTTPSFGEASCDDYFLTDAGYNSLTQEDQGIYTWSRGNYIFQNDWSVAYEPVYVANYCLEGIEKIKLTDFNREKWNNVKGSALFYRSYNFLNLMWVFAKAYDEQSASTDLGIVLRLGSDFNVPSKRASVQDCYNRIIQDAREAEALLPDQPVHVMRPSKAAAYGLLARTYLSMRNYDSAFKYADKCLSIKNSLMDYNGDADINGSITEPVPFKRFNKETIFYTEMNTSYYINAPWDANVDTLLYESYKTDDLRKSAFYSPVNNYYQFKGSYTASEAQYFTGLATDELYLIRAESLARTGRITESMNDLNDLMIKRWNNAVSFPDFTANNKADAIRQILSERRKELYMRGLRWIDIKRLNKENANIILTRKIAGQVYTLLPNVKYFALPIPADIIQLTGIEQN